MLWGGKVEPDKNIRNGGERSLPFRTGQWPRLAFSPKSLDL